MHSSTHIHSRTRRPALHRLALAAIALSAVLGAATPALATWRAHQEGNDWYIRSGNEMVEMPDEKTARKTAKKFNKIEKKAEKQGDGSQVYDDGSGNCDNPLILC